ncbi:MAG: CoA transferase, partial [Bacteroidetes bacterium]|nr:CoA transferase [Bacteroidota bacterium]
IDVIAAHHLKEAILIALIEKQWTGKGKEVNVSLFDAALASLANQASNYLMEGQIAKAMGTKHPNIAPYGDKFICSDGKAIILAVGSDKQFLELCSVLELEKDKIDQFKSNSLRLQKREELLKILQEKIAFKTARECLLLFEEKKIPAASIKNLAEVFNEKEAQNLVQNFILEGYKALRIKTLLQ